MAPKSDSRKRAPLGDISNIVPQSKRNAGLIETTCQRTRDRQRQRYAEMSSASKDEFLRKKREIKQRSRANGVSPVSIGAQFAQCDVVTTHDVNEWLSVCHNNMLSAPSLLHAPGPATERDSVDVKQWYTLCYNNLLSASSAASGQEQIPSSSSPLTTQKSMHGGKYSGHVTHSFEEFNTTNSGVFPRTDVCDPANPSHTSEPNAMDVSTPFQISSVSMDAIASIATKYKRRRERERYLQMSPIQKDALLERTRQYKQRKRQQDGNNVNDEITDPSQLYSMVCNNTHEVWTSSGILRETMDLVHNLEFNGAVDDDDDDEESCIFRGKGTMQWIHTELEDADSQGTTGTAAAMLCLRELRVRKLEVMNLGILNQILQSPP